MKNRFIFPIVGLFMFLGCFFTSVKVRDYFYERELKSNLEKIQLGMLDKEVIGILGKPNHIWSEDSPAKYWCYDTDTILHCLEEQPDIECGNMVLKMSSGKNGKVVKLFDLSP